MVSVHFRGSFPESVDVVFAALNHTQLGSSSRRQSFEPVVSRLTEASKPIVHQLAIREDDSGLSHETRVTRASRFL